MLSFFFNRFSKTVLLMEVAGIVFVTAASMKIYASSDRPLIKILLTAAILEYVFIRICAIRRWYGYSPRFSGIELQFKKALVPTSYIMAFMGAGLLVTPSILFPIISIIFFGVIAHVNIILIYFHMKDGDPEVGV